MSLNTTVLEELIDHIETKYEDQTILDGVEAGRPDNRHRFDHECHEQIVVGKDQFGTNIEKYRAEEVVRWIIKCEETQFLNDLDTETTMSVAINGDFGNQLLTEGITCVDYPFKMFLPKHIEYMNALARQYNITDHIPYNYNIPIYWFDPDIFNDRGFVINRRVAVTQERQGDRRIVDDDLDVEEIDQAFGQNRVIIQLRDTTANAVKLDLRTAFSMPRVHGDESICALNLPSPTNIEISGTES